MVVFCSFCRLPFLIEMGLSKEENVFGVANKSGWGGINKSDVFRD